MFAEVIIKMLLKFEYHVRTNRARSASLLLLSFTVSLSAWSKPGANLQVAEQEERVLYFD